MLLNFNLLFPFSSGKLTLLFASFPPSPLLQHDLYISLVFMLDSLLNVFLLCRIVMYLVIFLLIVADFWRLHLGFASKEFFDTSWV